MLGSLEKPWNIIATIKNKSDQTFIMKQEKAPIINGTAQFTKLAFLNLASNLVIEFAIEDKDSLNL